MNDDVIAYQLGDLAEMQEAKKVLTVGSDITPQQVREALADVRDLADGSEPETLHVLAAAARAWVDLYEECPHLGENFHVHTNLAANCPTCGGRGYVLNRERLNASANYVWSDGWEQTGDDSPPWKEKFLTAAVLAFLEGKQ